MKAVVALVALVVGKNCIFGKAPEKAKKFNLPLKAIQSCSDALKAEMSIDDFKDLPFLLILKDLIENSIR